MLFPGYRLACCFPGTALHAVDGHFDFSVGSFLPLWYPFTSSPLLLPVHRSSVALYHCVQTRSVRRNMVASGREGGGWTALWTECPPISILKSGTFWRGYVNIINLSHINESMSSQWMWISVHLSISMSRPVLWTCPVVRFLNWFLMSDRSFNFLVHMSVTSTTRYKWKWHSSWVSRNVRGQSKQHLFRSLALFFISPTNMSTNIKEYIAVFFCLSCQYVDKFTCCIVSCLFYQYVDECERVCCIGPFLQWFLSVYCCRLNSEIAKGEVKNIYIEQPSTVFHVYWDFLLTGPVVCCHHNCYGHWCGQTWSHLRELFSYM